MAANASLAGRDSTASASSAGKPIPGVARDRLDVAVVVELEQCRCRRLSPGDGLAGEPTSRKHRASAATRGANCLLNDRTTYFGLNGLDLRDGACRDHVEAAVSALVRDLGAGMSHVSEPVACQFLGLAGAQPHARRWSIEGGPRTR